MGRSTQFAATPVQSIPQKLTTSVICSALLYFSGAVPKMFTSAKTNSLFLYVSFALFVIFIAMSLYTSVSLQRRDTRWFESHERFLYVATGTVVIGSICWLIGMWPETGIWTVPLYLIASTLIANLSGLMQSFQHYKTA